MNYFSKILCVFSVFSVSIPCFANSVNFILISSHINFEHQPQLASISYLPSSDSNIPNFITKINNDIYTYINKNELRLLGHAMSSENEELIKMQNAVANGKLIVGFKNKSNESVAFIQDRNGTIFSVTKFNNLGYTIQSLGVLIHNT